MARTSVSYGSADYYASYKKRHPKSTVTKRQHADVMARAGLLMLEALMNDGQFKLFSRMGILNIRNVKPKGNPRTLVDFAETKKSGNTVFHFNDHSDGFIARVKWNREKAILADKYMWKFKPIRSFKRSLAKTVKAGKQYPIQL